MENNIFGFENLAAYQRAMDFVDHVYELLKKFPREEQFALCDQLRRAAVSVPSNMAEGLSRFSNKEEIHFLEISYASLMECYCQLNIAFRRGYISEVDLSQAKDEIVNIARPLSGLRAKLFAKVEG